MLAGQLSIEFGASGPSLVVATACASGRHRHRARSGPAAGDRCDVVLAGGSEAMITPLVMSGFARMGALSRRCDDPAAASPPVRPRPGRFRRRRGCRRAGARTARRCRARGAPVYGTGGRISARPPTPTTSPHRTRPAAASSGRCARRSPRRGVGPARGRPRQRARHVHPAQRHGRVAGHPPGARRAADRHLDQGCHRAPVRRGRRNRGGPHRRSRCATRWCRRRPT